MEKSGFFADIEGDRGYTDDFLAEWVASFIENGVYNTELGVMAAGDMNITVQPGRAWINGRIYILTEALTIPVEVSDGKLNRYTSIVLRADANARKITVQAVDGTYSAQPTAPNVTRNSEIYELKLADIYVAAGAISISQAEITDTRLDNEVCGLVYCPVEHIDTESLYNQIQTDLTNFRNISQKEFDAWFSAFISSANGNISEYENSFLVWFEHMKDQLSEDAAGNLQLQIDNLNNAALGGGFVVKGDAVSLEYVSENRIDTITAYGETPQGGTTDAPVALTGVDSVLLGGNNLLPKATETKTLNGVTFTPNPNGSVSVSGTATNNAAYVFANGLDDSLFGQTVCLSGGSMQTQLVINEKKPSGEWLRNVIINAKTPTAVGVLSKQVDDNILYGTIYVPTGTTVNTTIYPMLNLGSTAMPYEPYQGSVTPLPIPRPLRKVGDVRDVCRTRVKSVYDKRVVLDGSSDEVFIQTNIIDGWIQIATESDAVIPESTSIVGSIKSSYLKAYAIEEVYSKKYSGISVDSNRRIRLSFKTSEYPDVTSVETARTYLSAHPLTVYYQSTAYNGTNGLDICLTEYQNGFVELDGTEDWKAGQPTEGGEAYFTLNSLQNNSGKLIGFSSHFPVISILANNTNQGVDAWNIALYLRWKALFTDVDSLKAYLAAQKAAGTPVQIAYQLATPETYATDPLDIDNAAGPLTVMTGGELEVRMTELIGSRTYDADGDGVVDRAAAADRVAKKFILQNNAGQQMAEFDGSADRTVQLTPGQVGAEPAFTKNNAFNKNFGSAAGTVCQGNDGRLSNARRASNITMGYDGNLWINYS